MACVNTLSKLKCSDKKFFLLVSYRPGNVGINLKLSDGVRTWSGKFDEKEFNSWSEKTKLTRSDYKSQTLKALSGECLNGREFEYDVKEESDGSAKLIWKRVMEDADIKFQLGCVNLLPERNVANSICHILEASIELTQKLQSQIQSLTEERDRLTSERAAALQKLENCMSVKEDTEKDLYSKFVVVLNDKKAKIRELKEQLNQYQSKATSSSVTRSPAATVQKNSGITVGEKKQPITDKTGFDDSDGEYDTDDENNSPTNWKDQVEEKCSMNRKKEQEEDGVDLMLNDGFDDDNDDDNNPVLPKRLRKGKREMPKKPLSRTIIPHADSSDVQPGPLRKSSLRKAASRGSSHNLDVSNLIDAMD